MEDYDKNKESPYLQYWGNNNLNGWAMSKKLLVNNFERIKYISQFHEDFIRNIMKKVMKDIFFEVDVHDIEKLHKLHNNLPFLPDRMGTDKVKKPVANLHDQT